MRAVVQRVARASVTVGGSVVAAIGKGYLVLLGVRAGDDEITARTIADKIANLRVVADEDGKMNLSLLSSGGEAIVVSQFTLYGDTRHGRRPSFVEAAPPDVASPLCDAVVARLRELGVTTQEGVFGAHMAVELVNDGPVTILIEV